MTLMGYPPLDCEENERLRQSAGWRTVRRMVIPQPTVILGYLQLIYTHTSHNVAMYKPHFSQRAPHINIF
jgi:hypothetical protein